MVVVENTTKTSDSLKIQALYKLNEDSEYLENNIGLWSADEGFLFFNELTILRNRTNFFGMPLRVSYVVLNNRSFVNLEDNR